MLLGQELPALACCSTRTSMSVGCFRSWLCGVGGRWIFFSSSWRVLRGMIWTRRTRDDRIVEGSLGENVSVLGYACIEAVREIPWGKVDLPGLAQDSTAWLIVKMVYLNWRLLFRAADHFLTKHAYIILTYFKFVIRILTTSVDQFERLSSQRHSMKKRKAEGIAPAGSSTAKSKKGKKNKPSKQDAVVWPEYFHSVWQPSSARTLVYIHSLLLSAAFQGTQLIEFVVCGNYSCHGVIRFSKCASCWPEYVDFNPNLQAINTVLGFVSSRKNLATTFPVIRSSVEGLLQQ